MERNLVHARQAHEARGIVGDQRMIGAQYRAERMHALDAAVDAVLVEIVSEQIDAVRTGQIEERISIEACRRDPGRRLQKRADPQVPSYTAARLKPHAIG